MFSSQSPEEIWGSIGVSTISSAAVSDKNSRPQVTDAERLIGEFASGLREAINMQAETPKPAEKAPTKSAEREELEMEMLREELATKRFHRQLAEQKLLQQQPIHEQQLRGFGGGGFNGFGGLN